MCLDDLEGLVDERRRVHRDLLPHLPCRVPQRLLDRGSGDPLGAPRAERPARGGEDETRELPGSPPRDALQHGTVFRVHGHDLAAPLARGAGDELTGHDERFLVRVSGQRGDPKPVSLTAQHLESRAADRPRGSEDCHADGHARSRIRSNAAVTGRTKYSESRRSNTPPCPGMSIEESLTPTSRLKSDSATSPT